MGEHSSRSLLHKLVGIISLLFLWHARMASGGASLNDITYKSGATALQNVLEALGSPLASNINITSSYCEDNNNPIKCNCSNPGNLCHITGIIFNSGALSGYINEDVSYLKSLERLELSSNRLYGTIPDSLGSLSNLTRLNLQGNQLTGPIPDSLGYLTNLTWLDLSNNQLSGTIPGRLGNLSNLTYLALGYNQLTGPIPDDLKNLRSLETFYVNRNFLTGNIPNSFGQLSSLQHLSLRFNKLEGHIPYELGNLAKLEYLRLDENLLYGPLPPTLGRLSNLQDLWLTSNNFTGQLPQSYDQLTGLQTFGVAGNSLSGPIPSYIKNWVNLYELNLLGNNFEGPLPDGILNMTNLQYLKVSDLKSNKSFSLPANANLTIYSLILRNCSVTGPIPSNIGYWRLSYLDLSFNNLTEEIPQSLKDLYLEEMYLTGNMLSGVVPDWINHTVRNKADLSYNNFANVTLPETKTNHTNLAPNSTDVTSQKINIGLNRSSIWTMSNDYCQDGKSKYHSLYINSGGEEANINGTLYEADTSLSSSYVSDKRNWAYTCSGDFWASSYNSSDYIKNLTCGVSVLDEALYKKARLCPVSLTYYGFCLQKGRYTVKLHFAEVVYTENVDYSSLGKRVFDVYIQGERVLEDFNIKEKAGDPNKEWVENIRTYVKDDNLLTIHFFWAGKGSIDNPPLLNGPLISAISVTPNFKVGGGGLSTWQIAGITVASILAPLLLLALLWRMGLVGDRELRESRVELKGKSYTVKQIIDATAKFSPKMEIGRGRFGIVYKAELPNKYFVAVKKLSPQSKQLIGQIGSEVRAQKKYKHENLVELLDSYPKKDLPLMIYEYMEHTSLQHALFDPKSTITLSWEDRCDICLGMAEGLKYLHESNPMVIHRNIKPSNILLDGSLKAKISDFGLAKLYEEDNPYIVIGKEGTNVYMAPEYATRRAITDKVDVYSFGVVLLELISGKRNEEYRENQEAEFLLDRACVLHENGRLLDLVDEKLSQTYNPGQANNILTLAVKCVHISPSRRPKMSEVVSELKCYAPIFHNLH